MYPHTVTLYTAEVERGADYTETVTNHITILRGVLMAASKADNVRATGLESADAVRLYIPFDVEAVDGVTGKPKTYTGPVDFWRANDKGGLWTLTTGGDTFFIKGEAVETDKDFGYISMRYDDVYVVTKSDMYDFGAEGMPLWEVGAR